MLVIPLEGVAIMCFKFSRIMLTVLTGTEKQKDNTI